MKEQRKSAKKNEEQEDYKHKCTVHCFISQVNKSHKNKKKNKNVDNIKNKKFAPTTARSQQQSAIRTLTLHIKA